MRDAIDYLALATDCPDPQTITVEQAKVAVQAALDEAERYKYLLMRATRIQPKSAHETIK